MVHKKKHSVRLYTAIKLKRGRGTVARSVGKMYANPNATQFYGMLREKQTSQLLDNAKNYYEIIRYHTHALAGGYNTTYTHFNRQIPLWRCVIIITRARGTSASTARTIIINVIVHYIRVCVQMHIRSNNNRCAKSDGRTLGMHHKFHLTASARNVFLERATKEKNIYTCTENIRVFKNIRIYADGLKNEERGTYTQ